jgi:hypothetical protein
VVLADDARVALRCMRKTVVGSGKNRRIVETVVWEHEERIPPEKGSSAPGRTDIPVLVHLPAGSVPSDVDPSDNQVLWRLTAKAKAPGVDFSTGFEVPVFATG